MARGLLLDSGDTLMRPRGGRWNPRFDFEDVVRRHLPRLPADRLDEAFSAGEEYLRDMATIEAAISSKAARAGYHSAILAVLGEDDPTVELLEDLDRPLPFSDIVEPFTDTADGLASLYKDGWRIAIVADTSARMVDAYKDIGLDRMIETFVISGELGCTKPDPRMFRTASERLGLEPDECVFVDDNRDNLLGALSLGYHACGIARYHEPPSDELVWVRNLDELRYHLRTLRHQKGASDKRS
ncbi:MAG: HAD family hydrolase [Pseudonocardiaceae bacterium]